MRGQLRADASQQSVFRRDLKRRLKREALGRAMRREGPEITSVEPAWGQLPKIGATKSVNCSGMAVIVEMQNTGDLGVQAEVGAVIEHVLNFRTRLQGARRHS